jgi:endonuclease III related protein
VGLNKAKTLKFIYNKLFKSFGPQNWWPADNPLEIIVGAILTQNTSWANVERTIENLKKEKLLSIKSLRKVPENKLAQLIKPAGYYNVKTKRLKNFIDFLDKNYRGSITRMFEEDYLKLRAELLAVNGIGKETADSILLYAGNKPIFVVDAYTRRILQRHHLIDKEAGYSEIQNLFMDNLKKDTNLFNEYHALLVNLGKNICVKRPQCEICPIKDISKIIKVYCDSCGKGLAKPEERYVLKIQLYASPDVEISKEDLLEDTKKKIENLVKILKEKDPEELQEQVYVDYEFVLCKRCRDTFARRLALREFI